MDQAQRTERAKQIRSLIEDSGYSRKEAAALVDAGFGESSSEDTIKRKEP